MNFVLTLLRVLGGPHSNITNLYCHSQQVFHSGWCVLKYHQSLRAEVIYEASISYQGCRCLGKALRMTLWECEQIHQRGLSLRPKVLSRGWPSLEFHHWDMEHDCECVLKDKGVICQKSDEVSVCESVPDVWLHTMERRQFTHKIFIWFTFSWRGRCQWQSSFYLFSGTFWPWEHDPSFILYFYKNMWMPYMTVQWLIKNSWSNDLSNYSFSFPKGDFHK